mmetsp:Transcript_14098/g.25022  ORF Transcript_14098/g.25022 Transcript_14098/m.25022 type:complete len:689 (-) Transcript_14098:40-2106(-)
MTSNCNQPQDNDVFGHATACPGAEYLTNCNGQTMPWVITKYCNMTSFFGGAPVLPTGTGYGVILGFGVFFAIVTTVLVWLDRVYAGTVYNSEQFNTAGRSVKTGLTASVIVSHWTWAATLLQSSNVAYQYGVSGPLWYAGGACTQILLFGVIAVEIKRKAPNAHTMCEIARARWGPAAHKVFLFYALLTNTLVTAMLLLGGAAVTTALTGMNVYVASFLIPVGVLAYTMCGGLKATFLACYIHTAIIAIILVAFVSVVYMTSPDLGSPSKVYENLSSIATLFPVEENLDGSYLTMRSTNGAMFGVINLIGNFGTVFCDQAYWQSAIAAKPSAATRGYVLGGLVWFSIPFALATSLGLSTVALDLPVTVNEAAEGLVPAAAAVHFWGSSGAYIITIMLFMAVTSSGSAELVAVSTLFVYDVYKVYINPAATGKDILKWSRIAIVTFGIVMGGLSALLNIIGLSLGYVYVVMGVLIGSAVFPVSYLLLWEKCTAKAAMTGAVVGNIAAICSWLGAAQAMYGELTLKSTGANAPVLVGNLVAILGSGLICTTMSLLQPDKFDWDITRKISLIQDEPTEEESESQIKLVDSAVETEEDLDKAKKWMLRVGPALALLLFVAWPVLAMPFGVFSKGYFSMWVYISVVWALVGSTIIISLPLWESRKDILGVLVGVLTCRSNKAHEASKPRDGPI